MGSIKTLWLLCTFTTIANILITYSSYNKLRPYVNATKVCFYQECLCNRNTQLSTYKPQLFKPTLICALLLYLSLLFSFLSGNKAKVLEGCELRFCFAVEFLFAFVLRMTLVPWRGLAVISTLVYVLIHVWMHWEIFKETEMLFCLKCFIQLHEVHL